MNFRSEPSKIRLDEMKKVIDKVLSMWEKGTMAEICEATGLSKQRISYFIGQLRKNGVNVPRKPGGTNDTFWKELSNLYK